MVFKFRECDGIPYFIILAISKEYHEDSYVFFEFARASCPKQ